MIIWKEKEPWLQEPTLIRDPQLYYEQIVGMSVIGGASVLEAYAHCEDLREHLNLPRSQKTEAYLREVYDSKTRSVQETSPELQQVWTDCVLLSYALSGRLVKEDARKDILDKIKSNDFDTDAVHFKESLDYAISQRHGEYLVSRKLTAIQRMRVFKVPGVYAGFALNSKKGMPLFSELVALHNQSGFPRIGFELIRAGIRNGGKYLECFGAYLKDLYSLNFEVYETIDGIKGHPETLYFMKLKGSPTPR